MKKAVIIYGPPGSGKGTQAELLARRFNFMHFDTGRYVESVLYSPDWDKDPILKRERRLFDSGILCTPSWILKIVSEAAKKIAGAEMGITYSGSPRTIFEAFGDETHQGLLKTLEELYGKDNIHIISLQVSDEESVKRNSSRVVCSVCGLPILGASELKQCAFCYGEARKRIFDNPEKMQIRLKEFRERTFPIIEKAKQEGRSVHEIDGTPPPYQVHEGVIEQLGLDVKTEDK